MQLNSAHLSKLADGTGQGSSWADVFLSTPSHLTVAAVLVVGVEVSASAPVTDSHQSSCSVSDSYVAFTKSNGNIDLL